MKSNRQRIKVVLEAVRDNMIYPITKASATTIITLLAIGPKMNLLKIDWNTENEIGLYLPITIIFAASYLLVCWLTKIKIVLDSLAIIIMALGLTGVIISLFGVEINDCNRFKLHLLLTGFVLLNLFLSHLISRFVLKTGGES